MDITELIDRTLIADTLHAYCDRADRTDLDGHPELFTDDAVMDLGATTGTGHAELRPVLRGLMGRWATTNHHCSAMSVLRYDGAAATTSPTSTPSTTLPAATRRCTCGGATRTT